MASLSQNKKILLSAVSIFIVSFTAMVLFLEYHGGEVPAHNDDHGQASVLVLDGHGSGHAEEKVEEIDYHKMLKHEDSAYVVMNVEGAIEDVNEKFCDLTDSKCEELLGNSFFSCLNPEELPELVSKHSHVIQDKEAAEGAGPYRLKKSDFETLVLIDMLPIVGHDGEVDRILVEIKNLSEKIQELYDDDEGFKNAEEPEWIEKIYPKIKEIGPGVEHQLIVDLISYVKLQ